MLLIRITWQEKKAVEDVFQKYHILCTYLPIFLPPGNKAFYGQLGADAGGQDVQVQHHLPVTWAGLFRGRNQLFICCYHHASV